MAESSWCNSNISGSTLLIWLKPSLLLSGWLPLLNRIWIFLSQLTHFVSFQLLLSQNDTFGYISGHHLIIYCTDLTQIKPSFLVSGWWLSLLNRDILKVIWLILTLLLLLSQNDSFDYFSLYQGCGDGLAHLRACSFCSNCKVLWNLGF